MSNPRFSRATLGTFLQAHIERIQEEHNFTDRTGTAQLDGCTDQTRILAYGRKDAFEMILQAFDLY